MLSRDTNTYRLDAAASGQLLTPSERESLLKPYLPAPKKRRSRPVRTLVKGQMHLVVYVLIHTLFSLYLRLRQAYHALTSLFLRLLYHHHRTPELIRRDVRSLSRLPAHLSVILTLPPSEARGDNKGSSGAALASLLDDVAELGAWCASVGIPLLSVYEKTGVLKGYIPTTHRTVSRKLAAYFGKKRPTLQVRAPHVPSFLNGDDDNDDDDDGTDADAVDGNGDASGSYPGHLSLLLLSAEDGRPTLVDLTKTLAEMAQLNKLSPRDVSLDLIDAELRESTTAEPDLLILFGPSVRLDGYPPWQLRLTEIFHVRDNVGLHYLVWLKALHRFAKAHMRFGR